MDFDKKFFVAIRKKTRRGLNEEFRFFSVNGYTAIGVYEKVTPTSFIAVPHPSGDDVERPYMIDPSDVYVYRTTTV